jgi:hypothetical protein
MQATWVPSFGLAYNALDRKEREDRVTTLKGGPWRCVVNENGQHAPLTWREPAKISKLLLLILLQHTQQKLRKFLFCNINFLHIKTRNVIDYIDLSNELDTKIRI